MPKRFQEFAEGWQRLHPTWEMRLWGEGDLPPLINQDLYDRAEDLAPGFSGQLRSDIARYEILYWHGGVYLDCDYEAFRPIDDLLEGVEAFCAWEIQNAVANNAIMGATPQHEFLRRLITHLPLSVLSRPGARPSQVSGPRYITRHLGPDVTVFEQAQFYAVGCKELDRLTDPPYPRERARHWWNNQHRLKKRPL